MIISVKVLKGELNLKKNVTKHNKHVLGTLHSSFVYFTVEYISINSVLITIYPLPSSQIYIAEATERCFKDSVKVGWIPNWYLKLKCMWIKWNISAIFRFFNDADEIDKIMMKTLNLIQVIHQMQFREHHSMNWRWVHWILITNWRKHLQNKCKGQLYRKHSFKRPSDTCSTEIDQ